jgi:nucleoside-diphosphate-sugar epimerase
MRALVIGCGYLGRRVAALWRSAGWSVSALTRTNENATALAALGIEPIVGDVLSPESLRSLPQAEIVLYAVGHDRQAPPSKREVYIDGLANVVRQIGSRARRVFYVSSTSVYRQDAGEWVDETTDMWPWPTSEDGGISLAAEYIVREGCPHTILRFSGIYGPGRLLRRIEAVRSGEPIAGNPDGWLNLIHVDDGAAIINRLSQSEPAHELYLVTDDRPVRRREYYNLLARLVGAPEPVFQFEARAAGTGLNKRCSNARLKAELGDILRFPTIESGLPDAVGNSSL